MKTIKPGKQKTESFPYNQEASCFECKGVYRLEEGDRFASHADRDGRYVSFPCPNCGHTVGVYERPSASYYER